MRKGAAKKPGVRGCNWPDTVRLAVLVARAQGMSHPAIATALAEALDAPVTAGNIRFYCSRHGMTEKRLAPWSPPEGYHAEYKRLQPILGTLKAREEIELVAVRDKRRAQAA